MTNKNDKDKLKEGDRVIVAFTGKILNEIDGGYRIKIDNSNNGEAIRKTQ